MSRWRPSWSLDAKRVTAELGRRSLGVSLSCGLLLASAAGAGAETIDGFLDRMKDMSATLRLEEDLRGRLDRGDQASIETMAQKVRRDDGAHIETLMKGDPKLAMKVGPCHLAGIGLRTLIIGLGEGRLRAEPAGSTFATTPPDSGEFFADYVQRCETLQRLPKTARRVGTLCAVEGKGDGCE